MRKEKGSVYYNRMRQLDWCGLTARAPLFGKANRRKRSPRLTIPPPVNAAALNDQSLGYYDVLAP